MISSLYAAAFTFFLIFLSFQIIKFRRKHKLALGAEGHKDLEARIRAHGNFVEYTPFFIILLFLSEMNGLPWYGVHIFGIAFLIGRIFHAYSLIVDEDHGNSEITSPPKYRVKGMIITFLTLITLALALLVQFGMVYI